MREYYMRNMQPGEMTRVCACGRARFVLATIARYLTPSSSVSLSRDCLCRWGQLSPTRLDAKRMEQSGGANDEGEPVIPHQVIDYGLEHDVNGTQPLELLIQSDRVLRL